MVTCKGTIFSELIANTKKMIGTVSTTKPVSHVELIHEKNRGQKARATIPLRDHRMKGKIP
jgi:hypothetical protein